MSNTLKNKWKKFTRRGIACLLTVAMVATLLFGSNWGVAFAMDEEEAVVAELITQLEPGVIMPSETGEGETAPEPPGTYDKDSIIYIEESSIPIAESYVAERTEHWALLNLIMTAVSFFFGVYTLLKYITEKKREENRDGVRLDSTVVTLVSVMIFLLTQDMRLTVVWVDGWTILMVVLVLMQMAAMFLNLEQRYVEE